MGVTVNHVFTSPIADGTNTQLVRPSNWNETHVVQVDGFAGTGFSGTNISGTVNTNGISLSVAPGGGAGDGYNIVQLGTVGTTGTAWSSSSATVGINGSQNITVSQNNSNQIIVVGPNLTPYLTTAAQSDHSHGNPTLALTNLSGTTASNSAGFTLSLSANVGGGAGDGYNILAAGTQTAGTAATVNFANGNGVTFGMSNSSQITASHNGLTTARASNDGIGLNTALTAGPLAWTVNSGGISLNAGGAAGTSTGFAGNSISGSITHNTAGINVSLNHPAWLTTAAASNHSHGNPSLALTNINGTTASNSAGLTLSLSAVVPAQSAMGFSGSNGSFTASTLSFGNLNGMSFYTSNGSIVGSYTDAGAGGGVNFSAGTTSSALAAVTFGNGGNVSFGLGTGANAGVITASAPSGGGAAVERYVRAPFLTQAGSTHNNSSASIFPFNIGEDLNMSNARWAISLSGATTTNNTAAGVNVSLYQVLYSRNGSTLSSMNSGSNTFSASHSSNATASKFGARGLTCDWASSTKLPAGDYWIAVHLSTTTANATSLAHSISMGVIPSLASAMAGLDPWGAATANTRGALVGLGIYSTNATMATIGMSNLTGQAGNSATLANLWVDLRNWSIW